MADTFETWMNKVDTVMYTHWGLDSMCLPDHGYRDLYDDGATPTECVSDYKRAWGEELGIPETGLPEY